MWLDLYNKSNRYADIGILHINTDDDNRLRRSILGCGVGWGRFLSHKGIHCKICTEDEAAIKVKKSADLMNGVVEQNLTGNRNEKEISKNSIQALLFSILRVTIFPKPFVNFHDQQDGQGTTERQHPGRDIDRFGAQKFLAQGQVHCQ